MFTISKWLVYCCFIYIPTSGWWFQPLWKKIISWDHENHPFIDSSSIVNHPAYIYPIIQKKMEEDHIKHYIVQKKWNWYVYIYVGNWVFNLHYIQPHLQTNRGPNGGIYHPKGWSPEAPRNALPAWALKKHRRSERLEFLKVPNDPPSTQQNTGWSYNLLCFFDFFLGGYLKDL